MRDANDKLVPQASAYRIFNAISENATFVPVAVKVDFNKSAGLTIILHKLK